MNWKSCWCTSLYLHMKWFWYVVFTSKDSSSPRLNEMSKNPTPSAHCRKISSDIGEGGGDGQAGTWGEGDRGREHAPGCCQPAKSLDFHTGLEASEPLVRTIPIPYRSNMTRHSLYHSVGARGGRLWHLECIFGFFLAYSACVFYTFTLSFTFTSHIHRYGHFEWWQVVTFCLDTTRIECTLCWRQRGAAGDEVVRSAKGSSNTHRPGRGKCPLIGFPSTSPQHARHSECKTQPHNMQFNCVILNSRILYTLIDLTDLQLPCICLFHFHSVQLILWQHNDKKILF